MLNCKKEIGDREGGTKLLITVKTIILLIVHQPRVISCWEVLWCCVLPLATWTPSFVIFQSTSTPTAPQLTSVNSRLLLATARVGQRSSSLGGTVTVTSPRAETWKLVNIKAKYYAMLKTRLQNTLNIEEKLVVFWKCCKESKVTSLCPAQANTLTA